MAVPFLPFVLKNLNSLIQNENVLFRHKIGNRIKEITQKLDAIAANRSKFHLTEGVVVVTRVEYDVSRETSSVITEPQLYGRDEDKEKIVNCPKLEGLSREEGRELFPRLRVIHITDCPKLSFPHLSAPKELSLVGESTMGLNSISNLSSLTSLTIGYNDETVCFPKEFLRNLTLLESLVIEYCYELKVFPGDLASLVTLKSLKIERCPKLESLPEEGLRGLESLQSLHIIDCRELKRRCEKGKGEDWYKIAHIPEITVEKSSSAEGERLKEAIKSLSTLGYELLSYFIGREYFIHGYDPIYALSTDVVSSLAGGFTLSKLRASRIAERLKPDDDGEKDGEASSGSDGEDDDPYLWMRNRGKNGARRLEK
ncbi:putative disease resistance protein RGA3 [Camellia lanceoleosa]|uniref:Disease resistance protein RGA3 n=1 Tax=Camellia lanceoleosa TaxID=1840588 RepID=A0ACC0I415_9ERIC|nr:putative disease resistance protein RGA3 [Camellia lanceoleosa]